MDRNEIVALDASRLPELSAFLRSAFPLQPAAEFATPDILEWKYFDPRLRNDGPRSVVALVDGRIVAHVGYSTTAFLRMGEPSVQIDAISLIDWYSHPLHRPAGGLLMLNASRAADTQYTLGCSQEAENVLLASGYSVVTTVPRFERVISASFFLRARRRPRWRHISGPLKFPRNAGCRSGSRAHTVELRQVTAFGPEVDSVMEGGTIPVVFSSRRSTLLNHYLRYPRKTMSGWLVFRNEGLIGAAILNCWDRNRIRVGKIVDCFLIDEDAKTWRLTIGALTEELRQQGSDIISCYGSTPWMSKALTDSGFTISGSTPFYLRDRKRLIRGSEQFHLTDLEADLSYL
jgi:hypothetical protein